MAHEISNFLDTVKEHLTDAQYKEGMELCQKLFKETESPEEKLYKMTYLRPYVFEDDHCDDEDCLDTKLMISFTKATSLVMLKDEHAERIKTEHMFLGTEEEMEAFIDTEVFKSFPNEVSDMTSQIEWYEFPVLSIELVV